MNNGLICCFTGHRTIEQSHAESLVRLTDDAIEKMIKRGVTVFRNGGAVGFDTLAALKVIEKKKKYPHIRLEMYLPCKEQSKKWNDFSKAVYEFVLTHADSICYVSEEYTPYCMLDRNKKMIEGCDYCIAYRLNSSGGTAFTVEHAKKLGVRIFNLGDMLSKA